MAAFNAIFGDQLLTKSGKRPTEEVLNDKIVGVYFSAHWCPPCRMFTPMLTKLYKKLSGEGKDFEVVFVSSDRDEASFNEYFGEMPWTAVPYDSSTRGSLGGKYKVQGIPTFILLDKDGSILNGSGREAVMGDPEGAKYPWRPPTFREALGDKLLRGDGATVPASSLAGKVVALYFSAHWCGPCRAFTPRLIAKYNKWVKEGPLADKFEVVFVSSDRDASSFAEYFGEMPWLALPFEARDAKDSLSSRFNVEGIPTLILVDFDSGKVINADGRGAIGSDESDTGAGFPWKPPGAKDINQSPSGINSSPALIAFLAGVPDTAHAVDALNAAGEAAQTAGDDFLYFYERDQGQVSTQVRGLTSSVETGKARMVIINIPDNGAYYSSDADAVTPDTVEAFVTAFKAGALPRRQMQM